MQRCRHAIGCQRPREGDTVVPAGSSKRNEAEELRGNATPGDVGLQQPLQEPQQLELDDVSNDSSIAALT